MNIKQSLILCFAITSPLAAMADDFTVGPLDFSTSGSEAKVVNGKRALGTFSIPSTVVHDGQAYTVTAIENNAFEQNANLTSVFIPSTVKSIGFSAFNNCPNLTKVEDHSQVEHLDGYIYTDCRKLTTYVFSNSLQSIGYRDFANTGLTTIMLPASLKEIGSEAFQGCASLTTINFDSNLTTVKDHAFKGSGLTTVVLPASVTEIGDWSFEACKDLTYVQLPTAANTLKDGAFFQCTSLESIVIPANFTAIYNNVFDGCKKLSAVYYLGSGTPNISERSFADVAADFAIYVKPSAVEAVRKAAYFGDKVTDKIPYSQAHDFASFSRGFDVDFTSASGLTAYVAEVYNEERKTVTIQSVDNAAAGTGLVIQAKPGTAYQLKMTDNAATYSNNLLRAAVVPVYISVPTTAKTKEAQLGSLELTTDRALYNPANAVVRFTATGTLPTGAKVRYLHGNDVVGTDTLNGNTWEWTAPNNDHQGYMAEVYTENGNTDKILATIGVDVSSTWSRFPRYGFLSFYDNSKLQSGVIENEVAYLNRLHINGLQFYDWQWQHHKLWKEDGSEWRDFGNRQIVKQVLKDYISQLHGIGAKCMFYDLCYGITGDKDANGNPIKLDYLDKDGVSGDWGMNWWQGDHFRQGRLDYNDAKWPSIYLMNPSNDKWISYMKNSVDEVYKNLDFDGYHIDQVGKQTDWLFDRGGSNQRNDAEVYNGFAKFVNAMKTAHPEKDLVMNSVSSYGRKEIVSTGNVEFGYNEMWQGERWFTSFYDVIKANKEESGNPNFNTVFAAYMHFRRGFENFNTPLVLMTEANIFALGGAHIELSGDGHMLSTEYFPDNGTKMKDDLKSAIVKYYDFMTAYENYLRDGGEETPVNMSIAGMKVKSWAPEEGFVTTYAKTKGQQKIIQLLNFSQADRLTWRLSDKENADGQPDQMPEPYLVTDKTVTLDDAETVSRIWVATPDAMGGASQEVKFTQANGKVTFTLPSLKYWTMVVVEHGSAAAVEDTRAKKYLLKNGEFRIATAGWLPAGKAYIQFPASVSESLAKIFTLDFAGIANGIRNGVKVDKAIADGSYYTLSGVKVQQPVKGLYIHNGKTVIKR